MQPQKHHPTIVDFAAERSRRAAPGSVSPTPEAGNTGAKTHSENPTGQVSREAKKSNEINWASGTRSRIGFPETHTPSRPTCPAGPEDFKAFVASKSVNALRQAFPHEFACLTAIKGRAKAGKCAVSADMADFKGFLRVLGPAPSPEHTVDRIDPCDPEYAPGKVRWADKKQQARNRVTSITIPYQGQDVPIAEVAERTGQKADTLRARLRSGCTPEEVISGRRAGQAPALPEGGWPSGSTVSMWEGPFKGWKAALPPNYPGATRAVFFAWIASNLERVNWRVLEREFPEHFSPTNADEGEDSPLPPEVLAHRAYRNALDIRRMLDDVMPVITADPAQVELLRRLRRRWRGTDPKKAREVMTCRR